MKVFKNTGLQGFSIPFNSPEGIKYVFIGPKVSFKAPDSWTSKVAETLVARRMFKITQIQDTQPSLERVVTAPKKLNKNR